MRVKDDLSFKDVDELLSYNPGTGVLTWKVSRGRVSAGARAGSVTCYGYLSVRVMGSRYMAHRLAYLLYYGVWPDEAVDHFDRDRLNNKISNLRPCSWAENATNVGHYKTNTSGLQGASYRNGRWRACMRALGVHIHLGFLILLRRPTRLTSQQSGSFTRFGIQTSRATNYLRE